MSKNKGCCCCCQPDPCNSNIGGLFGENSGNCCNFSNILLLLLIVLQFSPKHPLNLGSTDSCNPISFGGNNLIDNSILFIIAFFYLTCCRKNNSNNNNCCCCC